ncbi:metallophosphoesterase family protein [Bacillus sp. FSL K6-3431]|uniref:metallophosphoesterase family protein n=1 Tax=Bacillus sp. FSL K6-3431 TaxID=2921500 RepID=UPI0030FAF61C
MKARNRKQPITVETFETGIEDWRSRGDRCQSVSIRRTAYPEPVRFGNHALELSYDFSNTIGTSGAYAYRHAAITVEDIPSAIGMWVYGDESRHMVRAQMRDGNQHAFQINFVEKIDWKGWKFVTAPIPEGKVTPLALEIAVRLLETNDKNKNAGSIYIDEIQAIYGENDQDVTNPLIAGEYPSDCEVVNISEFPIHARVIDEESGIHPESIKLYVDGVKFGTRFNEKLGEVISDSHLTLLNGMHQVQLIVHDRAGNESEKVWQFEVDANQPGIKVHSESSAYIGEPFEMMFEVNKTEIFDTIKLHFYFNPEEVGANQKKILLHEQITQRNIVRNEITETGHIYLELKDLYYIQTDSAISQLGKIDFCMKKVITDNTKIGFLESHATLRENSTKFGWCLAPIKVKAKAHYRIAINRATVGFASNIIVMDEMDMPVKGVRIVSGDKDLGVTNEGGLLRTKELAKTVGDLTIQAEQGGKYSFSTKVKVLDQLCSQQPTMLNITFNENPTYMNITWATSPLFTNSIIEYVKKEQYAKTGFSSTSVQRLCGDSEEYAFDTGEIQMHAVSVTLEENNCYVYRVGDGTAGGWSEISEICTPKVKDDSFHFIVLGDTQAPPNQTKSGYGLFKEIINKAKSEYNDPAFFVHVGDMIDDGNLYAHWGAFFRSIQAPDLAMSTPLVPTVGNHENIGAGVETFKAVFKVPNNGPDHFLGTAYMFDYGNACFAILNTETSSEELIEQAKWLTTIMSETNKKWKIVVQHRGPYFSNPDSGSEYVQQILPQVFDQLNIDLVISGHDHSYVRTYPLKNGEVNKAGTTYLIAGSTGKKFYAATPQPYMKIYFDEKTQVYTNIAISKEKIHILVKKLDGTIVDQYKLEK